MIGSLAPHLALGHPVQRVVDEGGELLKGSGIASLPRVQERGDLSGRSRWIRLSSFDMVGMRGGVYPPDMASVLGA